MSRKKSMRGVSLITLVVVVALIAVSIGAISFTLNDRNVVSTSKNTLVELQNKEDVIEKFNVLVMDEMLYESACIGDPVIVDNATLARRLGITEKELLNSNKYQVVEGVLAENDGNGNWTAIAMRP